MVNRQWLKREPRCIVGLLEEWTQEISPKKTSTKIGSEWQSHSSVHILVKSDALVSCYAITTLFPI